MILQFAISLHQSVYIVGLWFWVVVWCKAILEPRHIEIMDESFARRDNPGSNSRKQARAQIGVYFAPLSQGRCARREMPNVMNPKVILKPRNCVECSALTLENLLAARFSAILHALINFGSQDRFT